MKSTGGFALLFARNRWPKPAGPAPIPRLPRGFVLAARARVIKAGTSAVAWSICLLVILLPYLSKGIQRVTRPHNNILLPIEHPSRRTVAHTRSQTLMPQNLAIGR